MNEDKIYKMADNSGVEDVVPDIPKNDVPSEMTNSMYISEPDIESEKVVDDDTKSNVSSKSGLRRRRPKVAPEVPQETTVVEETEQTQPVEEKEEPSKENVEATDTPSSVSDNEEESEGEDEEEDEEEGEEEGEGEGEEEGEGEGEGEEEGKVRYIRAIVVKEKDEGLPFPITCAAALLIFVYSLKLFFILCAMTGCSCKGNCICLS